MWFWKTNKSSKQLNQAYNKLKDLQHFLNEHFPEGLPLEKPDEQKFPTADEFLAEEARLWPQARQVNRFISEG